MGKNSQNGAALIAFLGVLLFMGCRAPVQQTATGTSGRTTTTTTTQDPKESRDFDNLKPSDRRPPPKYNPITTPLSGRISFSYIPASCPSDQPKDGGKCSPVSQGILVGGGGSFQWDKHSNCWVAHGSYQFPGAVAAKNTATNKKRRHPYDPVTVRRVQVTLCERDSKELELGFMFTHPSFTRVRPSGIPGRSSSNNLVLLKTGAQVTVDKSASPKLSVTFEGRLESVSCYMAGMNAKNECNRQESGLVKGSLEGEIPSVAEPSRRYYPFMTDPQFAGLFTEALNVPPQGVAASTLRRDLDRKERFSPLYFVQIDPKHRLLLFYDKEGSALINAHVFDGKGFYQLVDIHRRNKGLDFYGRTSYDSSLETIFVDIDGDKDIDMISREWSEATTDARGKRYVEETERIRVSIWDGKDFRADSSYRVVKNGQQKIFSRKNEISRALRGKTFDHYFKSAAKGRTKRFRGALSEVTFKPMYCPRTLSEKERRSPAAISSVCRVTSLKVQLSQEGCRVCLNKSFLVARHGELRKHLPNGRYTATLQANAQHKDKLRDSVVTFDVNNGPQDIVLLREAKK
jgi:hypothetical protein